MRVEPFLDALGRKAIVDAVSEDASPLIRPTTDRTHGDYQMNAAMALAKKLGRPPRELAAPIAEKLRAHPAIASAEVAGPGFVNIKLADAWIASELAARLEDPQDGVPRTEKPARIVVDYSGPNIAKQMHVGHLRSTIIGDAIVRLLRFIGHEVIGDIHLGDWGTQFGLLIVGMAEWGDDAAMTREPVEELERVYKLATQKAEADKDFAQLARNELQKLQQGDPHNRAQWERFVAVTRTMLDRCYAMLDVTFDEWLGESAYNDMLPGVVNLVLEKKIAREDQGAICVFWKELEGTIPPALKKQNEPFIIRKKDGAFLYSTSDIATVLYRRDHFHADRAVYVVDVRQSLHFTQLFAIMRLLGVEMELEHVGFGMMLGTDGKPLRTRDASGKTTPLVKLLDEAVERAANHMREEKLEIPEAELANAARVVGIGAVKYADLRQNRTSDYQFDWDKLISFKGNAGPYMQYAYARIASIFRKAESSLDAARGRIEIAHDAEAELARRLLAFPDVVHQAAETYQPHLVPDHLFQLAKSFSGFYESCPILKSEGATRESRLALAALTARQIRRGLALLGIGVVDRM